MSYQDVADMAEDWGLRMRLIACAAQEYPDNPVDFIDEQIWRICGQPGWGDAWQYSRLTHADDPDFDIGMQEDVVTDGMILSGIQEVIRQVNSHAAILASEIREQQEAAEKAAAARQLEAFTAQREIELANPILPVEIPAPPPEVVQLPVLPEPEPQPDGSSPANGPFEEPHPL
jgi:hypothetical protein